MNFKLLKTSKKSQARLGILKTAHGKIPTPFFMPIATRGSVKSLASKDLKTLGADIILSNTYHLYFRPGLKVIQKSGGLHQLMNWPGPILTDSGGFQVFSLGSKFDKLNKSNQLVRITEKGAEFRSVYDGSKHLFTPQSVIKIQQVFGSDIMMVLDQCVANPASRQQAEEAAARTLRWAKISQTASVGAHNCAPNTQHVASRDAARKKNHLLFAIVQGSLYKDLRLKCAQELGKMNFAGYAIGGLAVGESPKEMYKVLDYTVPALPQNKPHYLMGVGYPEQIIESVKRGIDMFDCVIPTREARHGRLYVWNRRSLRARNFYKTINIASAKFAAETSAINPGAKLPELREYSKAYLRHLFSVGEPLALRLATLNNLEFYLKLMEKIRVNIKNNKL